MNTPKQCPQPGQKSAFSHQKGYNDNDFKSFSDELPPRSNRQNLFRFLLQNRSLFFLIPVGVFLVIGSISLLNASFKSPLENTEALRHAFNGHQNDAPLPDVFHDDLFFGTNEEIQNVSESFSKKGKEALSLISTLESYEDHTLSAPVLFGKYQSMMTAATIISATASDLETQQLWSGLAIGYGQKALTLFPPQNDGQIPNMDEVRAKLLMSMALNFLQGGPVQRAEIIDQYHDISPAYTTTESFRNNKLFKAMERQGIFSLPDFSNELEL